MFYEVVPVRRVPSLFGLLLAAGFILWLWKWVLLVVGIAAALFLAFWLIRAIRQDLAAQQELARRTAERADLEDRLFHAGDPRGTYGLEYSGDGQEAGS